MLTACWFLSASLKWGQEAIDAQSQWFHLVAWGLPAIMTIVVQVYINYRGLLVPIPAIMTIVVQVEIVSSVPVDFDAQSQWFHLVAWGLPAIMTIVV
jgi:Frizzled/Smoothened family membrane region